MIVQSSGGFCILRIEKSLSKGGTKTLEVKKNIINVDKKEVGLYFCSSLFSGNFVFLISVNSEIHSQPVSKSQNILCARIDIFIPLAQL